MYEVVLKRPKTLFSSKTVNNLMTKYIKILQYIEY